MEFRLIIKDTRDGKQVYETKMIDLKSLDQAKYPAEMLLHTVTEMRRKVEEEFSKPATSIPLLNK